MPTFSFPTLIQFGPGVRKEVGAHLKAQGVRRPLLVTDKGLAALPLPKDLMETVRAAGLEPALFSDIAGNPVESSVTGGVAAYRAHQADGIIGLGGGAALDVAKAIALMAGHPGALFEYEDGRPDARPIDKDVPYWVALPTTAGTGSEVGRSAVISDANHIKRIVFSPKLLARAVFADPELTLALPAKVTAATGMDALTHCIEAYLAKDYHPICDGIALEGLRLAAKALPRCIEAPGDIQARSDMMMASMMGAIAFQKGLGLVHSCAHALSTVADLHHGFANGVMIDSALRFNLESSEEKFVRMAQVVGIDDTTGEGFLRWLRELKARIGIPAGLKAAGVDRGELERLSRLAFQDSCHQNNPRPCREDDFRQIYTAAFA
ncbi:MAG TPA: iron-containing alcohol dehydrogenase [Vicinamibacteria bacterium]|nr:iron-containing alcohol dehydrogenase [Vicinamibacteria bacterium]